MNPIELKRGDNFKGLSDYLFSGRKAVSNEDVLAKITAQKSVFNARDIRREVGSNADVARVLAADDIVLLETGDGAEQLYTAREMIELERAMIERAQAMSETSSYGVRVWDVEGAIARANADLADQGAQLSSEQIGAIESVTGDEQIAVVSGLAGAGKSTMLAAAREAWEAQGFRVRGSALSGKAAEGLQEASGIQSRTLASYQRGWEMGYGELEAGDVFVIDEAGMVGSRQLAGFICEAEKRGAKIVLVGDEEQLQAINGGSAFRAIADRLTTSKLEEVRRQKEDWQREASKDFAAERTIEALEAYDAHGAIRFEETTDDALSALVRDYVADIRTHPEASRIALAHRRVDIRDLNQGIRDELKAADKIGEDQVFRTRDGLRAFGTGDRLMFLENNRELDVKNGMIGTVVGIDETGLTVDLDNGRQVAFDPRNYQAFDHGYACTVHKAQGVTVDNALVYATRSMDRHLAYVAMTRHRDSVQMYVGRDEMINMRSLTKNLSNSGVKATTLDFAESADQQQDSRKFNAAAAKQEKTRVGWSMAMNVGDMAPEKAWAAMRNTAESADLLKEANGIRVGGRKCSKPVYHYSITWPSEDAPSDKLQKLAVKDSLKELALDDHEIVAVQHLDGDHPHVHVMVNLIHPETGMSASTAVEQANGKKASKLSYGRKKLRKWANRFEKKHGLKITEGSAKNEEKRQQGEKVDARRKARNVYEREKREHREAMMGWFVKQQTDKGREIGEAQRARKGQSASKWKGLFDRFASARAANDNVSLKSFVNAAKGFDREEREEHREEKGRWRSYGEGRSSAFNELVQGAAQQEGQGQERGQEVGIGQGLGRRME